MNVLGSLNLTIIHVRIRVMSEEHLLKSCHRPGFTPSLYRSFSVLPRIQPGSCQFMQLPGSQANASIRSLTELVLGISRSKAAAAAPATALRTWNCMPGESPAGDGDGDEMAGYGWMVIPGNHVRDRFPQFWSSVFQVQWRI